MDFGRGEGDQVFRILLEGTQYFLKFTGIERMVGNAVPTITHFIGSIVHQEGKTAGKMAFRNLLRSGEELKFLTMQGDEKFKAFAEEAKRYGVIYSVVRQEPNEQEKQQSTEENAEQQHDRQNCIYEVAIRASDAAKINRIIENLEINSVIMTAQEDVQQTDQQQTDNVQDVINNMFSTPQNMVRGTDQANPQQAAEQHSASAASLTARRGIPESDRPSIRENLETAQQLVAERDAPQQQMMPGDFIPNLMGNGEESEEERMRNLRRPASEAEKTAAFGAAFEVAFNAAWSAVNGTATNATKQGMVAEEPAYRK